MPVHPHYSSRIIRRVSVTGSVLEFTIPTLLELIMTVGTNIFELINVSLGI